MNKSIINFIFFLSFKAGNGIGMKIVGGKTVKGTTESGAFVTAIFPGGVADQLHGELKEGNHFTNSTCIISNCKISQIYNIFFANQLNTKLNMTLE